ncbi:helix-turn-helix domain-containing protein [Chelatococcus sambhunathii]|uniref:Helix-turn-helix domain-containing protein n=1 Tax=Chelatococcus sambhunathii TaxID=363953 RepID=A0ABU1DC92_9HYPH|nr:helix-turn-helix domain-containing protein [Chelatococcus sambhunathii]MDR4305653.1 helix-turn-helix domain-containing protein [Chelatococcus sambhunathii]
MSASTNVTAGQGNAAAVFTVPEAAVYLRISRASVYRLFDKGELRAARIGGRTLVRRIDADALLERAVSGS